MNASELFEEGRVRDAVRELSARLRQHPDDTKARTFLFELLSFSGEHERAAKQLDVLAQGGSGSQLGAVLCYSAVHADQIRHALFSEGALPIEAVPPPAPGILNGKPFESIRDADSDIGARLEVFAAGAYVWIPFAHIASIEIRPPETLRDTLWAPALVRAGPSFQDKDLGEVMLPVIYPFSWRHPDENVWLGRLTAWMSDDQGREYPMGQRLLVVDGEEVPFLEVRKLEFTAVSAAS